VKTPKPANDNLLDKTLTVWQPRSRRNLSREDAREIAENVTGFFSILHEWSRGEVSPAANDSEAPQAANDNDQAVIRGETSHDR
jgi:hypothetical protein